LTRSGFIPTFFHSWGEHANHYTNDVICKKKKFKCINRTYKFVLWRFGLDRFSCKKCRRHQDSIKKLYIHIERQTQTSKDEQHKHYQKPGVNLGALVMNKPYTDVLFYLLHYIETSGYWYTSKYCFLLILKKVDFTKRYIILYLYITLSFWSS